MIIRIERNFQHFYKTRDNYSNIIIDVRKINGCYFPHKTCIHYLYGVQ